MVAILAILKDTHSNIERPFMVLILLIPLHAPQTLHQARPNIVRPLAFPAISE